MIMGVLEVNSEAVGFVNKSGIFDHLTEGINIAPNGYESKHSCNYQVVWIMKGYVYCPYIKN